MRIHYIQHELSEDPGYIREWLFDSGHPVTFTHVFENQTMPGVDEIDFLIVLGGSMGANDDQILAWMPLEKALIRQMIEYKKPVLGICLGAQLIASVLGAEVFANAHKEIGWFDVNLTNEGINSPLFNHFPSQFVTFHWHGDTFDLPEGAVRTARNQATNNQAFVYQENVVGLQFHPEMTTQSIESLLDVAGELVPEKHVQPINAIIPRYYHCHQNNAWLKVLLEKMVTLG